MGVGKDFLFGTVSHGRDWSCRGVAEIECQAFQSSLRDGFLLCSYDLALEALGYYHRSRWDQIRIGPRLRTQISARTKTHIRRGTGGRIRPRPEVAFVRTWNASVLDVELTPVRDLESHQSEARAGGADAAGLREFSTDAIGLLALDHSCCVDPLADGR